MHSHAAPPPTTDHPPTTTTTSHTHHHHHTTHIQHYNHHPIHPHTHAAAPCRPTHPLLGPTQKRDHLRSFIEQRIGRPVTVLGASLGGTVAIDFAVRHPELVDRLVLVDAQAFVDANFDALPGFVARLGVKAS